MNIKKIKHFLKYKYLTLPFSHKMPDDIYLKKLFKINFGYELDLENPQTFNEKLQWLKLYNRRPEYTVMVDKYKVREYITEKLGAEYLIPLLGVWDEADEIDFDSLPNQFVLKCNHNSGTGMYICKDKSSLNIPKVKAALRKGLKENYFLSGREWPYKDVPRKIICEKYMADESGYELKDYKIHCFNGKPEFTLVCRERFSESGLKEDFMDLNWKRMDLRRPNHPNGESEPSKPLNYNKMLSFAEELSQGIPFLRVDFYEINAKLYFGELTFFPASGMECFVPDKWDFKLGSKITLQKMRIR